MLPVFNTVHDCRFSFPLLTGGVYMYTTMLLCHLYDSIVSLQPHLCRAHAEMPCACMTTDVQKHGHFQEKNHLEASSSLCTSGVTR